MRRAANAQLTKETLSRFWASLQSSRSSRHKSRPTKSTTLPIPSSSGIPTPGDLDPSIRAGILSVPPEQTHLVLTRSPPPFIDALARVRATRAQQHHQSELYKQKAKVLAGSAPVEVRKRKHPEDWLPSEPASEPFLTQIQGSVLSKSADMWTQVKTKRSRPADGASARSSAPSPKQTPPSTSSILMDTVLPSPQTTRQTPFGYAARPRTGKVLAKQPQAVVSAGLQPSGSQSISESAKAKKSTIDSYFGRA